jgi:hypothetical protein
MNLRRSAAKRYRSLTTIGLLLSSSLLPLLPAQAVSPPPGTIIENQATATFTDAADGSTGNILSDKVSVTVAEVAGISADNSGITGTVYRTNTVFFDFIVRNEGNDPTKLFVPAKPSAATLDGVALPAGDIGQLQVVEYSDGTTATPVTTGNLVNTTTGASTSALTGVPNSGSVPAGGYIKVRVPVTVPFSAVTGKIVSITLGNTGGQPATTNTPFVVGANAAAGTGNDLYTEDNANGVGGETNTTAPINGDAVNHRQEASATQTATVVAPANVTIKGTVIDDANGSANNTFTNIQTAGEAGANVTPVIYAVLVDADNKVVTSSLVGTDGTYTLTTPGVQNGLRVILSSSQPSAGLPFTGTGDLPPEWAKTSPLNSVAFDITTVDTTGKDFGVDKLPVTVAVTTANQSNPPGASKYQVPTLKATDAEDDPTGTLGTIKSFKILTLPDAATQGILYYDDVAVTENQIITNYDPTKLKFDPLDGPVSMSFTYAAIDAAGKQATVSAAATMTFAATNIVISGTVYNDKDNSANNTFTNIPTNGEVGTDAVFGTTTAPAYAILTDAAGLILQSVQVASNGTYSFTVASGSSLKVAISGIPGILGETLGGQPVPPEGWVFTSPFQSDSISGFLPVTQDFGIRQKAKFVLIKRITKINGLTTNPNDGTVLTGFTSDTYNTGVNNWPTNYIVGKLDAGKVKPGDTIEYTVYFLNNQGADAKGVKICDPIKGSQDFLPGSMKLKLGGASSDTALTDADDGADRANHYLANQTPNDCADAAALSTAIGGDNGGVAIGLTGTGKTTQADLTGIPGATGVATPAASYGLFRFSTKVGPGNGSAVSN